ncbi:hypothetical protein VKT23_019311 [Stygiomarasmius scandens]|uniref:Uncharacterized protein n=1 Tax=Marasmiellus scandens TaxID=2682957 RepID=A0ABR1ILU8_9AGAR
MRAFDGSTLWDDYGVIDGIMPFTYYFPRADIHELLSPDLLHQVIKGTFKDHLVTWVFEWVDITYTKKEADRIKAEIDRRLAAVPLFPNLQRFKEGHKFKQWTGNDSKALMKIFLSAIHGLVPDQMVRCITAFTEFCYMARRDIIDNLTLDAMDDALQRFHKEHVIFQTEGVHSDEGLSLPRQHSLTHYRYLIQEFGAPNGLCSSITESKHIEAVKRTWRRSSRWDALKQMLVTNQRVDKLVAARVNYEARGMMSGPWIRPETAPQVKNVRLEDEEDDNGGDVDGLTAETVLAKTYIQGYPHDMETLAFYLNLPMLPELIRRFLYTQERLHDSSENHDHGNNEHDEYDYNGVRLDDCPEYYGKIFVYPLATATFYAPSDLSGLKGWPMP